MCLLLVYTLTNVLGVVQLDVEVFIQFVLLVFGLLLLQIIYVNMIHVFAYMSRLYSLLLSISYCMNVSCCMNMSHVFIHSPVEAHTYSQVLSGNIIYVHAFWYTCIQISVVYIARRGITGS